MNNPGTISQKLETLTRLTEGYDAFLYDCDGTLADNMQAHKDAYVKVAATYGLEMDPAIIDEFAGLPTILVVQEVNKRYGTQIDPTEFATAKSQTFFEDYIEKTLPVDFVVAHLKAHHGKVRIAVVSGGSRKTVTKTLTVLGIFDLVEVMVCAGETPNGKPYPDPFLKAAELLNIAPERCFVFEDGEPGVAAASAAGMQSVRVDKIV